MAQFSSNPFFVIATTMEAFLTSRSGEWRLGFHELIFKLHGPDRDLVQGQGSGVGDFGVVVLAAVYCNRVVPN
jgi:hypothetical protein